MHTTQRLLARRPHRLAAPSPVDMLTTCAHVTHMPKMIQIRHVPDALHRTLKVRAAEADMTLSDYIKLELERMALADIAARLNALQPIELDEPVVDILQQARDAR
jgi:antitoxin FitA